MVPCVSSVGEQGEFTASCFDNLYFKSLFYDRWENFCTFSGLIYVHLGLEDTIICKQCESRWIERHQRVKLTYTFCVQLTNGIHMQQGLFQLHLHCHMYVCACIVSNLCAIFQKHKRSKVRCLPQKNVDKHFKLTDQELLVLPWWFS